MPTPAEIGLTFATPSNFVDVVADINDEITKVALYLGIERVTSGTRPSSNLFLGRLIEESDTGRILRYIGSSTWQDVANAKMIVGAVGTNAPFQAETTSTIGGNRLMAAKKNGEANQSWMVDFDGKMQWGPGGGTSPDTNLYRTSAGVLKTDQALYASSASRVPAAFCIAYTNATQSLTSGAHTAINFQAESIDNSNMHSTVTNVSRFTPTIAGYYQFTFSANFAGNTTGSRAVRAIRNGAVTPHSPYQAKTATPIDTFGNANGSASIYCNGTTDYVEITAYQSSGGALNLDPTEPSICIVEWKAF